MEENHDPTVASAGFSRRRVATLLSLSILCCIGVPFVSWETSRVGAGLSPYVPLAVGGILMCLTIPFSILGTKRRNLRGLLWLAVFLNTVGSGFYSAAYTIHLKSTPTPSEMAVPAAIPAALLLLLLIVACLLPEEHRDTAAGGCAVVGVVALVTVIVGWCRAEEPLLFAGCFFSLIMAESLVIALVYACNDPNMTGTAYAIASCCYVAIIGMVVLVILVFASGSCDCDCCDCPDCGSGSKKAKKKK